MVIFMKLKPVPVIMALIPTHIRFAIDVAKHYQIDNFQRYISGTVYPDTRWITGIDRNLTHHPAFLKPDFPKSDFTLGWHIHCVCDELQKKAHQSLFNNLRDLDRKERWILLSAAKVIQDMNDLQQIDLHKLPVYSDYAETPNGEDIRQVKKFHQIIKATYVSGDVPSPGEYGEMWQDVGLDAITAENLVDKLEWMLLDTNLELKIQNSYEKKIHLFDDLYC